MNKIEYSFLIILFCFSNILAISEVTPSKYSNLLGKINRGLVITVLNSIPKRTTMQFTQFLNTINNKKKTYNLNDQDSAYLAYKWIAQNIFVQYNLGQGNIPQNVYQFGRGSPFGISRLFKVMSDNLGFQSIYISGYVKVLRKFNYTEMISEIYSAWNVITFGQQTYLVDASLGAGNYNDKYFERGYTDAYFATKPTYFIFRHYPFANYQLLTRPIDLKTFKSYPFVDSTFFLYGFYKFEPMEKEVQIINNLEFEINYDPNISNGDILPILREQYRSFQAEYVNIIKSNGEAEIIFEKLDLKVVYLEISIKNNLKTVPILVYKLIP